MTRKRVGAKLCYLRTSRWLGVVKEWLDGDSRTEPHTGIRRWRGWLLAEVKLTTLQNLDAFWYNDSEQATLSSKNIIFYISIELI